MRDKFQIITYSDYCQKVLLTEETTEELMGRVQAAFPDPEDFKAHKAILDKFPNYGGKQIVTALLIRTRFERKRQNITPDQTWELLDEFRKIQMAMTGPGQKIDLALLAKQDKTEHPDDKDSKLFEKLTLIVHEKIAILRDRVLKKQQKKAVKVGGEEEEVKGKERLQFPNADDVYVDNNVEIYLTLSPGIIRQMVCDPDSVCTQRSNYFGYRFSRQATLYIVIPRTPELRAKYRFLQFDLRPDGTVIVVDQRNQQGPGTIYPEDRSSPQESLKSNLRQTLIRSHWWTGFPELKDAVEKDVFKNVPIQTNERTLLEKIQEEVDNREFQSFDYITKTAYISYGHKLSDEQWNMVDNDQKNAYINASTDRDLTQYQFDQIKSNNQLIKRYLAIKKRTVISKIERGVFTREAFTPHESLVLGDILKTADPKIKEAITRGLIDNIKKALTGSAIPQLDISGMYNLVKPYLLKNPSIMDEQFLLSVAKLLAGEKSTSWRSVKPEVLQSIYAIAKDIYDVSPQKMDEVINDIIRKDSNVLLQGLLSQPTHFQSRYFDKNKDTLMANKDFSSKLDGAIESHLVYGTLMPVWLKSYWNDNKNAYLKDTDFVKKIKYNLTSALYGKISESSGFNIDTAPEESKEIYNMFITDIRSDTKQIMEIVRTTLYDMVMSKDNDVNDVKNWTITRDFKDFFTKHEKEIKSWLTYKLIDTPPEHVKPALAKLIGQYKDLVLSDPNYQTEIENKLVTDIVSNSGVAFRWSGDRIAYWMEHFWDIINKHPGVEKALVERIKKEYGTDRSANAFYTEYGIPLDFYKRYENDILSDPEAKRGLKQKVVDQLQWRTPKEKTTEDAVKTELSPIERDFYNTHRNEFPESLISSDKKGT